MRMRTIWALTRSGPKETHAGICQRGAGVIARRPFMKFHETSPAAMRFQPPRGRTALEEFVRSAPPDA
jgi:hypothetical protein